MGIPSRPEQPPLPLLAPMLAVTAPSVPADQHTWSFEPKFDGFRGQLLLDRGQVRLRSRTGKPMTWLPELNILGQAFPHRRLIFDGELVAVVDGRPSIAALQQRMRLRRPTATSAPVLMAVCYVYRRTLFGPGWFWPLTPTAGSKSAMNGIIRGSARSPGSRPPDSERLQDSRRPHR